MSVNIYLFVCVEWLGYTLLYLLVLLAFNWVQVYFFYCKYIYNNKTINFHLFICACFAFQLLILLECILESSLSSFFFVGCFLMMELFFSLKSQTCCCNMASLDIYISEWSEVRLSLSHVVFLLLLLLLVTRKPVKRISISTHKLTDTVRQKNPNISNTIPDWQNSFIKFKKKTTKLLSLPK